MFSFFIKKYYLLPPNLLFLRLGFLLFLFLLPSSGIAPIVPAPNPGILTVMRLPARFFLFLFFLFFFLFLVLVDFSNSFITSADSSAVKNPPFISIAADIALSLDGYFVFLRALLIPFRFLFLGFSLATTPSPVSNEDSPSGLVTSFVGDVITTSIGAPPS